MIKIKADQFPDWNYGEGTPILRISRDDIFVASSGVPYVGGERRSARGWFVDIICEVGDSTIENSSSVKSLFVPDIFLAPTVDSDAPFTSYIAELFDETGEIRKFFLKEFRLPTTENNEITWEELRTFQNDSTPPPEPSGLTTEQQYLTFLRRSQLMESVQDIVEDADIAPDASASIKGRSKLSVEPENPVQPIAVGINDPLFLSIGLDSSLLSGGDFTLE